MRVPVTLGILVLLALTPLTQATTLARAGRAQAVIVLAANATLPERTAAQELAHYLHQITGGSFTVQDEQGAFGRGSRLYVGATAFAEKHGLHSTELGSEEWVLRTVGSDLIIMGGRPRGTLYAAYHFLEDELGVHWWNPFEESVPHAPTLRIGHLDRRGRPTLAYRDIYMLYGQDGGQFAARNRLNREGDAPISARYGGSRDYGPPYHVHTFSSYVPPSSMFSRHPEWFSLIDNRRVADGAQLCLTQPEMREFFLKKLLRFIETSRAEAQTAGVPPPVVYSVSQNDCLNPCQCATCQAVARAEESECGPLLDFVNYLADAIRERFPDVYLDTLAYQYTQKAPKTIRPRDNVIIRLCDTESDPTKPITDEANRAFREHLARWSEIAHNLRVWDYAVTYANPVGLPVPTAQTYGADFQFYAEHHVEGVFTELEFEILADLRDFKVWMMMKLLENPRADYGRLVRTFTDGFYGRAGGLMRRYLSDLEKEAKVRGTKCNWNSTPASLTYLNLQFVQQAHSLFDRMEKAAGADDVLLRRVRHARLPLDRATLALFNKLSVTWQAMGKPPKPALPDRLVTGRRALETWLTQAQLRLPASAQEAERLNAEREMRRYAIVPSSAALPEKFRARPAGTVHDYLATMSRNWGDVVKVVKDAEAESGIANKLDLTAPDVENPEKYVLPMPWGLYGPADKKFVNGPAIRAEDIPGPGYHWYQLGTFPIETSFYAYFFWSWIVQFEIDDVIDPAHPEQPFEVWARVKFTGPRFPHARPGETNAIYIERLVLAKP